MADKLEITIEVIAHATENVDKILESFFEKFEIEEDSFSKENLTGHFENPITVLRAKFKKKEAKKILEKLVKNIPENDFSQIINNIENRLQDSTLNLRFGKQDLIKGRMIPQEKDAIKIKIFTPSYKKDETVKNYVNLLTDSI
jgi:RNA binding exosome subunit